MSSSDLEVIVYGVLGILAHKTLYSCWSTSIVVLIEEEVHVISLVLIFGPAQKICSTSFTPWQLSQLK